MINISMLDHSDRIVKHKVLINIIIGTKDKVNMLQIELTVAVL